LSRDSPHRPDISRAELFDLCLLCSHLSLQRRHPGTFNSVHVSSTGRDDSTTSYPSSISLWTTILPSVTIYFPDVRYMRDVEELRDFRTDLRGIPSIACLPQSMTSAPICSIAFARYMQSPCIRARKGPVVEAPLVGAHGERFSQCGFRLRRSHGHHRHLPPVFSFI